MLMELNAFFISIPLKTVRLMCIGVDEQRARVPLAPSCVSSTNHNVKQSNTYNAKLE